MTILVKNGLIYDGSERPPEKKDVLISGKKIIRLGNFSAKQADRVIDAMGMAVMPGFIDLNNEIDHYDGIFSEIVWERLLRQGVTTVIGGNRGISLAPVMGSLLTPFNEMADVRKMNINWHSVKEFLAVIGKKGIGINFGTLVGYSALREALTRGKSRDLTLNELEFLKKIISRGFKDGAFGLSLELNSRYLRGMPYFEIKALGEMVFKAKRACAFDFSVTSEKMLAVAEEILKLSKETAVNIEINHLTPLKNLSREYLEIKNLFERESAASNVNFDITPLGETVLPLYKFLPDWFQGGPLKEIAASVKAISHRERLLKHFAKFDVARLRIVKTPKALKFLEGKTLKDLAASHHLYSAEAIRKFMELTRLEALVAYQNVDKKILEGFIASPKSIIVSNGLGVIGSISKDETEYFVFNKFLSLVKKKNILPLEKAIAKITSIPAQKYQIQGRGLIKEGHFADLVVSGDSLPAHVILNGCQVVEDGVYKNIVAGSVLKYSH